MIDFSELFDNTWFQKGIKVAITVIIGIVIYSIVAGIIRKYSNSAKVEAIKNKANVKSYLNLIINIIRYTFVLIVLLVILKILEVDITSIVAGVGIFGACFALILQDFFKDITRGSNIISADYFKVGDVVKYKDVEGKVIYLGLKNTKIQVLKTNNIMSIANRNIEEIEVLSNFVFFNIPLPYELKVLDAEKVVNEAIDNIKSLKNVEDALYIGTNELADSSILYQVKIKCNPIEKLQVRRDSIRQILLTLEKHNISVPYNQIDVHQK